MVQEKVFLSGKITGDPDYKEKFAKYAEDPFCEDKIVLNPAVLPGGMENEDYMRICMAMIDTADVVAFLPDFEDGRGSLVEWYYCQYIRKPVYYF